MDKHSFERRAPPRREDPRLRMPRGPMPAWALGGALSLIVLAAWAIFLQFAPPPEAAAPSEPPAAQTASAPAPVAPGLRLLLWRNVVPREIIDGFKAESG